MLHTALHFIHELHWQWLKEMVYVRVWKVLVLVVMKRWCNISSASMRTTRWCRQGIGVGSNEKVAQRLISICEKNL